MEKSTVVHATFSIERRYPVQPGRVFAAFADPAQKRRWFSEGESSEVEKFELDFRVGGVELTLRRFKAGTPFAGTLLTSCAAYLDLVPDRRIVFAYTMSFAERRISASLSTFEFLPAENGTGLFYTEQAAFFEEADGPEIRKQGWQALLEGLGKELGR